MKGLFGITALLGEAVVAGYRHQAEFDGGLVLAIADPAMETGLQGTRSFPSGQDCDGLEERALAGAVVAGEHAPARMTAVRAPQVET
jgi:hypothetical protein